MLNSSALRLIELLGGFRISRIARRYYPRILMYHRVLPAENTHAISPEVFELQVEYLKRYFRVVSVNQLVNEAASGKLKPYTLALTFDDGHQDFYAHAWPILRKYDLPASLYVTTGFVDQQCWLWPDLLRYLLDSTKKHDLVIEGIGALFIGKNHNHTTWSILGDLCLKLEAGVRVAFLEDLARRLNVTVPPQPLPPFAPVSWDQLREMHKEGLDIGSHSVSHPIFSSLTNEELHSELALSRKRIFEEIGEAPKGICYPNGMARDVTTTVEQKAKQFYSYGLVAYPNDIIKDDIMHLGRWAAPNKLARFKQMVSGLSRNDNHRGEYR